MISVLILMIEVTEKRKSEKRLCLTKESLCVAAKKYLEKIRRIGGGVSGVHSLMFIILFELVN